MSQSSELEPIDDYQQQLRNSMWQALTEQLPPLSAEAKALLQQQNITATEPGTILTDFQTLLDFVGENGIAVSGKQHLLTLNSLTELNQLKSAPIQTALKRPQQKSYPPINGLYLLLRASGLGQIVFRGKKPFLVLNPELLSDWRTLNPTDRYFNLLEAWLIRAHDELLGARRSSFNEGTKCLEYWPQISPPAQQFRNYGEQKSLNYWPELHNLALMQLFGLLRVESGPPQAGKGWRVKMVQQLPFGSALMELLIRVFIEQGLIWSSEDNPSLPFGELQPLLQPYFPQWQHNLIIPEFEFRHGVFIFKVSLGKIWRRIAISSHMTLAALSRLILKSVNFDCDHLDMFSYQNQLGRTVQLSHPSAHGSPSTDEVCIGDLPLREGASLTYVFDSGDRMAVNSEGN